jgi:hypothetical protein
VKKIPTLFLRDYSLKCTPVTDSFNPECQWVFDGEGIATRKVDGINIKVENSISYMRITPNTKDYIEADYGRVDNKYVQYALGCYFDSAVAEYSPLYRDVPQSTHFRDGIYEAYGEGIRGNAEKVEGYHVIRISPVDHALVIHGIPRTYRGIMGYLATHDIEGIVFHHRDGRMAKIKTRDFYHLTRP